MLKPLTPMLFVASLQQSGAVEIAAETTVDPNAEMCYNDLCSLNKPIEE